MIGFTLLLYGIFIVWLIRSKSQNISDVRSTSSVSIVIAYRNETHNLNQLLQHLKVQNFSSEKLELIIVDDHSEDDGSETVEKVKANFPYTINHLSLQEVSGKKASITKALEHAQNDIVICTDADCLMQSNWVEEMSKAFQDKQIQMALGPVKLIAEKGSWFQHLQVFEFSSLMAITLFTANRNRAIMSNGANYAFRRKAFLASKKFEGNEKIATGDDVFLLHSFKKQFGKDSILFVEKEEALIETKSTQNIKSFLAQRVRWASKSKNYRDYDTIKLGFLIAAANLVVLIAFFGFLISYYSFTFFFGVFCFKWILDLVLIQKLPNRIRTGSIVKLSFVLSIIYPFYSVGIALVSLFYRPEWKGRKI